VRVEDDERLDGAISFEDGERRFQVARDGGFLGVERF
jgi:hypothetical protein